MASIKSFDSEYGLTDLDSEASDTLMFSRGKCHVITDLYWLQIGEEGLVFGLIMRMLERILERNWRRKLALTYLADVLTIGGIRGVGKEARNYEHEEDEGDEDASAIIDSMLLRKTVPQAHQDIGFFLASSGHGSEEDGYDQGLGFPSYKHQVEVMKSGACQHFEHKKQHRVGSFH